MNELPVVAGEAQKTADVRLRSQSGPIQDGRDLARLLLDPMLREGMTKEVDLAPEEFRLAQLEDDVVRGKSLEGLIHQGLVLLP